MKKIAFNLLKALPAILIMTACSQVEEPAIDLNHTEQTTRSMDEIPFFSSSFQERRAIAKWLAQNYTLEEAEIIHNAVQMSHSLGLDEIFYLIELMSETPTSNKVVREVPTEVSKKFKSELLNGCLAEGSVMSTQANNETPSLFSNERLTIYWPYSENWDGVTTPIFVYAPSNVSDSKAFGYIYNKNLNTMVTVSVDEEYCEHHPVWVITESETPYSQLPNFANGETVSPDGILYSTNSSNTVGDSPTSSIPYSNNPIVGDRPMDPTMTLRLGYVRSEKNHDTWIAGGSEYVFRFASLKNANLSCAADTSKCIPDLAKTKICFTRTEIKNKTPKVLNAVAVSDWPKSLDNIVMTLVEEDPGSQGRRYNATVTVTWSNKKYGFDISIPYGNYDDELAERTYSRNFITSTNNKGKDENGKVKWIEDCSDGVYWTLPYEIGWPTISGTINH